MGKPAYSLRNKLIALCAAGLIACGFVPFAFADGEASTPMLASSLLNGSAAIVNEDVTLIPVDADGNAEADTAIEPIIGSFTVDGLTFAVNNDGGLTLVSVAGPFMGPEGEGDARSASQSSVILSDGTEGAGAEGSLSIPQTVSYASVTYPVTAIGPYAFYLSGVTQVELPASIMSVDDRTFRSSDVERVEVAADNPNIASFDGCLYDSQLTSLLLIPEGRAGAVLLPCETEVVEPSKFSHCSLVDAISVEEGGAAFASWEGLLYDASGTTLLRVPAGAVDITIREGCTTIAAGAMEGCAKLECINAPATVTSISPNVLESVPTVSLPVSTILIEGESEAEGFSESGKKEMVSQLTAVVTFDAESDVLSSLDVSSIETVVTNEDSAFLWERLGFAALTPVDPDLPSMISEETTEVVLGISASYSAATYWRLSLNDTSRGSVIATAGKYASGSVPLNTPRTGAAISYDASSVSCSGNSSGSYSWTGGSLYEYGYVKANPGYLFKGWSTSQTGSPSPSFSRSWSSGTVVQWAIFSPIDYTIALDPNGSGAQVSTGTISTNYDAIETLPVPIRLGYKFCGWNTDETGSGTTYEASAAKLTTVNGGTVTLYAQWVPDDHDISFETSAEPRDEEYLGESKPDETVKGQQIADKEQVAIEDPKRPGYVFQGWVIPNGEGTEAIDQDLVYQGDDGKWYVDAEKLPDYATDGKVELTARWTSIISVDVPSAVTFYADVVTQDKDADDNQKSLDGAVDDAFGQAKVTSQSQVDLRIVGLESEAAEGDGANSLGASDVLVNKASASVPASSGWKLFSLFPSSEQFTADDLKDTAHVSAQPEGGVTFDIDDILLEKSFAAEDFTIPAGETLSLGYRLNLKETQQALDYDKLSTLGDGQSAAIANISYCFAAGSHPPTATGSKDDPLYIEYEGRIYGLMDIKDSAECISKWGEDSPCYGFYKNLLDKQVVSDGNAGAGPYFKLKINDAYWDLQLIGIAQDVKSDGSGKAGLTFQLRDMFSYANKIGYPGSGSFDSSVNSSQTNAGGWMQSGLRQRLRTQFYGCLDAKLQSFIAPVDKFQQVYGGSTAAYLQKTTNETVWLPSTYELLGKAEASYNGAEGLTTVVGYQPFRYQAYLSDKARIRKYNDSATQTTVRRYTTRSANQGNNKYFNGFLPSGEKDTGYTGTSYAQGILPCFCL